MSQRILVAVDGSDPSRQALEIALSAFEGPTVTVVHVLDPIGRAGEDREGRAKDILADAEETAAEGGHAIETTIRRGDVSREIVTLADQGDFDHVVIGSHGRTGIDRLLLGSVAEKVIRRSPIPVMVVQ